MSDQAKAYTKLVEHLKGLGLLRSCASVLGWDEQTNLPPKGAEHRANQLALLAGLSHDRATDPVIGELLDQLADPNSVGGDQTAAYANVRNAKRAYDRSVKLPKKLVEELSRTTTLSQHAWVEARQKKDFTLFHPWLEKIVTLKREEADALGSETGVKYDALIEDYEPGATAAQIQSVFAPLREALVELVSAIKESDKKPDISILERKYPVETQKAFSIEAATAIGFDFQAGRLDVAAHPFCSGFGPGDCRLTTRYDEHHFPGAFFGTLHEAGHGIYEQGLNDNDFGLATGEACSLGIHESQSRMWENLVGRSRAFWDHFYGKAQQAFPDAIGDVHIDDFYSAVNDVRPSWIRVEADEVTYNLHIMLRFQLEQALLCGDLNAADVPAVWNETFTEFFGMTPSDDSIGCLQDVHWSAGLIGYFPTYSLGNMYASQFFEKAQDDLGDLNAMFAKGEFMPLKEWLNNNIHIHGRRYDAPQLVEVVTGKPLTAEPLLKHLRGKFGAVYGL
ncbi:carboxypeptidase M32 [Thalassoglobus polymorphus]|uniref:Metal-dependent carboxypeptidase n=1 Tax=Thalassoglobus polymorphus TaxID=2527994 RepID=A0A517QNR7_9PLAN|nr:carboxypeptidase M32 [Thalassoglobus polymorphus]QDT33273.1 Thermostable carboxypeptidase 1 [Thalassoglobus polymorphus]